MAIDNNNHSIPTEINIFEVHFFFYLQKIITELNLWRLIYQQSVWFKILFKIFSECAWFSSTYLSKSPLLTKILFYN